MASIRPLGVKRSSNCPKGVVGEMKIVTSELPFKTTGQTDIINITREVQEEVLQSGVQDGSIMLFISGSMENYNCGIPRIK